MAEREQSEYFSNTNETSEHTLQWPETDTAAFQRVRSDSSIEALRQKIDQLEEENRRIAAQIESQCESKKRNQEIASERERILRRIVNRMPMLVWSADPAGMMDFVNDKWLAYTGMRAEQSLGVGWIAA